MGEHNKRFTMAPALTPNQFDLVYNLLSLGLASMASSTVFFFLRLSSFAERYKAALCFTGLVTFIAMYHYFRIFNSFTESYTPCEATTRADGVVEINYNACNADVFGYTPTGIPFNDAYRYVDWLLTVPLLLIEIVLVMKLSEAETFNRCLKLGVFFGLKEAQEAQPEAVRDQVKWACWATVFSWCTYPIVFIFPMLSGSSTGKHGLSAQSMVAVQI